MSAVVIPLLPDVESVVCAYLRSSARVAAVVDPNRVYTAFPARAGGAPLVLVQRVGGTPPLSIPLVVDDALVQLDAYGGTKRQAELIAATCRAELSAMAGTVQPDGVVAGVSFGAYRYLPDETFRPSRPRYVLDVTITTRAADVTAAARRAVRVAQPEGG